MTTTKTTHTPEQEAFYKAKSEGKTGAALKPFRQAMSRASAKDHKEINPELTPLGTELLEILREILEDKSSNAIQEHILVKARAAIAKAEEE
jgi:hypothetical protein